MLDYAASRRQVATRPSSPHAMLVIISVHVALLALVMSAKMDLPARILNKPITVDFPRQPPPPPPNIDTPRSPPQPRPSLIDRPKPVQPLRVPTQATVEPGPPANPMPIGTGGSSSIPFIPQPLTTKPIRHDALLLTPSTELKPPYPASKLASEEEATLRLRLTIDEHGRVVAVDPVGPADRVFLDSARRYLIAHWRYEPATEDGRPVISSLTVTLRFELDS
jgi:protein TonB